MKRIILLIVLLIGFTVGSAQADETQSPDVMARYFHSGVDVFAAIRTDPAYFDQMDDLWLHVSAQFPDENLTFREAINQIVQPNGGLDVMNFVSAWIGDYAAIGVDGIEYLLDDDLSNDEQATITAVVEVTNPAAAYLSLIGAGLLQGSTQIQAEPVAIYANETEQRALAIGSGVLTLVLGSTDVPVDLVESLADLPGFQTAAAELPAGHYDAMAYVNTPRFSQRFSGDASVTEMMQAFGFHPDSLRATMVGWTMLDSFSGALDIAQVRASDQPAASTAIDLDFARYMPADVSVMAQTTDLSNLTFTLSSLRASLSATDNADDAFARFENLTALLLELDLREDILRWTTGNYGIFVDVRGAQFLGVGSGSGAPRFGMIIEATDPDGALKLSGALGSASRQFLTGGNITITDERLIIMEDESVREDVPVTSIVIQDDAGGALDIVIGANEEIFFIATRESAVTILSQTGQLHTNGRFAQASDYLLSEPTVLLYLDGNSVGELATFGYDLIAPSNADLLEQIFHLGIDALPEDVQAALDPFFTVVNSSSISATASEEGNLLLRLVVTLAE